MQDPQATKTKVWADVRALPSDRSPAPSSVNFRQSDVSRLLARRAVERIRAYAPTDASLHGIVDRLRAIQRRNFYQLAAEVSHRGRYTYEYTMSVEVTRDSPTWQPPTEGTEEIVTEALRDLARWLYRQLQAEYDHLTSNEAVEEGIVINEYAFTEAGRRFG